MRSSAAVHQMLEVVEQKQQLLVADMVGEAVPGAERLAGRLEDEPGSRSGASGTQKTPSGKRSDASAAAWSASRVFPVPPGPVSVSKRVSSSSVEHARELVFATEERRRRDGQVRAVQRLQRREVACRRAGRSAPARSGP